MESQPGPPEECLRSLTAEALRRAQPDRELLPDSLVVMATANAFVMLGLIAEGRAEEILAGHRAALEAKGVAPGRGVNAGGLTVRPGAHEYWTARGDSATELADLPLRVLTRGRASGWLRAGRDGWELHGEAAAAPDLPAEPGWLEFGSTAAGERVRIPPPPDTPVGTAEPPWPTPAEAFTGQLARINGMNLNGTELTPDQTAGIVATAADCLLAVGALPASSVLLSEPRAGDQDWQAQLASRWSRRAWQQAAGAPGTAFRLADHRGLAAELPLKHATAIIESVSAHGGLVIIRLYGHPWVMGEYWPMMEASERLTITVSTLWEAAWADVDLPGRTD